MTYYINIKWNDGETSTLEACSEENKSEAFWEYANKYRKSGNVWCSTRATKEYYKNV